MFYNIWRIKGLPNKSRGCKNTEKIIKKMMNNKYGLRSINSGNYLILNWKIKIQFLTITPNISIFINQIVHRKM